MIKDILDAFITAKEWGHDRTKTIGSSEVGGCIRRTWYVKNSTAHGDNHVSRWGAAERGNLFENYLWEPALRKRFGKNLLFAGKEQQTFIDGQLSATPDGLIIKPPKDILKHLGVKDVGDCLSVECKTIDPRVNLAEAKHNNMMQVQVAMGTIRAKTKYKPNYALISYANASFLDDITEFAIPFDPKLYDAAKTRAAQIYDAEHATDLKPEGYIKGGKECDHCPFVDACGIARHNLPSAKFKAKDEIDPQLKAEFIDMVRAANELKHARDAADGEYRTACEEIKDRLREKGLRKIQGVLNWAEVNGRHAYDMDNLIMACASKGIDVEQYSRTGEKTSRLTLEELPSNNAAVGKKSEKEANGKSSKEQRSSSAERSVEKASVVRKGGQVRRQLHHR